MITNDGFEIWYALWEDVLASDLKEGQRMALSFVARCLRSVGDREYLHQRESS